jgi:hypothetical protein
MQLEINSYGAPVTIERVQYDFDTRTVSDGKVPVILPAKSQRIFIGGVMVIPGFELEGEFEMINNPDVFSVSVKAYFNAFDTLVLDVNGAVAIVKGSSPGLVVNTTALHCGPAFSGSTGSSKWNPTSCSSSTPEAASVWTATTLGSHVGCFASRSTEKSSC